MRVVIGLLSCELFSSLLEFAFLPRFRPFPYPPLPFCSAQHAIANGFGNPSAVRVESNPERIILSLVFGGKVSVVQLIPPEWARSVVLLSRGDARWQQKRAGGPARSWLPVGCDVSHDQQLTQLAFFFFEEPGEPQLPSNSLHICVLSLITCADYAAAEARAVFDDSDNGGWMLTAPFSYSWEVRSVYGERSCVVEDRPQALVRCAVPIKRPCVHARGEVNRLMPPAETQLEPREDDDTHRHSVFNASEELDIVISHGRSCIGFEREAASVKRCRHHPRTPPFTPEHAAPTRPSLNNPNNPSPISLPTIPRFFTLVYPWLDRRRGRTPPRRASLPTTPPRGGSNSSRACKPRALGAKKCGTCARPGFDSRWFYSLPLRPLGGRGCRRG